MHPKSWTHTGYSTTEGLNFGFRERTGSDSSTVPNNPSPAERGRFTGTAGLGQKTGSSRNTEARDHRIGSGGCGKTRPVTSGPGADVGPLKYSLLRGPHPFTR